MLRTVSTLLVSTLLVALVAGLPRTGIAQQTATSSVPPEATGWTEDSPFRPLDIPAANRLRMGSGAPGPDYWQQKVDYRMRTTVDTAGPILEGSGTITYHNRSPETLDYLWLKIDANLCDPEGIAVKLNQPPLQFGDAEFDFSCYGGAGMTVSRVAAAGRDLPTTENGTLLRVELPEPLRPGDQIDFGQRHHSLLNI